MWYSFIAAQTNTDTLVKCPAWIVTELMLSATFYHQHSLTTTKGLQYQNKTMKLSMENGSEWIATKEEKGKSEEEEEKA